MEADTPTAEQLLAQSDRLDKQRPASAGAAVTTQPQKSGKSEWTAEMAKSMAWSLLGFTAFVLLLATLLLWRKNVSSVQIVRLFLLVLIVSMSCFLVVVGYDQSQLTPVIGLFGAICGYLLGRETNTPPPKEEPRES